MTSFYVFKQNLSHGWLLGLHALVEGSGGRGIEDMERVWPCFLLRDWYPKNAQREQFWIDYIVIYNSCGGTLFIYLLDSWMFHNLIEGPFQMFVCIHKCFYIYLLSNVLWTLRIMFMIWIHKVFHRGLLFLYLVDLMIDMPK